MDADTGERLKPSFVSSEESPTLKRHVKLIVKTQPVSHAGSSMKEHERKAIKKISSKFSLKLHQKVNVNPTVSQR